MKKLFSLLSVISITFCFARQPLQRNEQLQKIDTTGLDLEIFARKITGEEPDDYEKAKKILSWLSGNFEWKATDYKTRTVKEIIARNGGNCFELAKVYMALIREAGITYRSMAEINIHPLTPRRQTTAADMVKQKGNTYSVFGLQHNDHRWVEIYDKKNDQWQPADPSMGVIGVTDWLKARVWFGERKTIDTAITNQMIVPFAIFIAPEKNAPADSRSAYYLIDKFNELYGGKLSGLPEWKEWSAAVNSLTVPAKNAFWGKENLHSYQDKISKLAETYERLKQSYLRKYRETDVGMNHQ
jgi:hypothetical protein